MTEEKFENIAFEEPDKYSFFKGFFITFKEVLFHPRMFFSKMHVNKGYFKPLLFALIIMTISIILFQFIVLPKIPKDKFMEMMNLTQDERAVKFMKIIVNFIWAPFTIGHFFLLMSMKFAGFLIFVIFFHIGLAITRASRNGFQATFRIFAYSSAVSLLNFVPILNFFMIFWWFIVLIRGVEEAHEVTKEKAMISSFISSVFMILSASIVIGIFM